MLRRFCIYAVMGLVLEIVWTGLAALCMGDYSMQGRSSVLMLPVYGAAVLLEPLFELYSGTRATVVRYAVYGIFIITAEYYFGRLYSALGVCPWDYTGSRYSVEGLIRLDYLPLWCCVGAVYEGVYRRWGRVG